MESQMDRNTLETEVLECVVRTERAIEELYLEWYYYPKRDIMHFSFTYRIELDKNNDGKSSRIRIRSGSGENRKTFYIGAAIPALKALIFLRPILSDVAIIDLQRILSTGEFPFWFYKDAPDGQKNPYDPVAIMKMTIANSKRIKPLSSPMIIDIDDLSGFFIEEYPNPLITYKRLESRIDLLNDIDLNQSVEQALINILPKESNCSFRLTRLLGRYWNGEFSGEPYQFYIDMGWDSGKYILRFLNIAGFPNNRKPETKITVPYPQLKWPR